MRQNTVSGAWARGAIGLIGSDGSGVWHRSRVREWGEWKSCLDWVAQYNNQHANRNFGNPMQSARARGARA